MNSVSILEILRVDSIQAEPTEIILRSNVKRKTTQAPRTPGR